MAFGEEWMKESRRGGKRRGKKRRRAGAVGGAREVGAERVGVAVVEVGVGAGVGGLNSDLPAGV